MREMQFRETSADTERIKYNTNGIKTEVTAESSAATRFTNTSADVQLVIVTNARNGILLQAILCRSLLKVFSKGTTHESRKIPVPNLKALSG